MPASFLPLGLLTAFALAMIAPSPGAALNDLNILPWLVATIFLFNGYQTRLSSFSLDKSVATSLLVGIAINLLIAPWVGLGISQLLQLSDEATLGFVVMMTVPATLSSGIVICRIAGGDATKALVFTISLNMIGIFTIPFMLQSTLAGIELVTLSPWPLLQQLITIVLCPFAVGVFSQRLKASEQVLRGFAYVPSLCVITAVWIIISDSAVLLKTLEIWQLLHFSLAALLGHTTLLFLLWLYRLHPHVTKAEWLALFFPASQKTLPVAVGVLTSLNAPISIAVLVCILTHFIQLFMDAWIAQWIAAKADD